MFCACNLIRRSRWHVQVSGAVLKWASKVQATDREQSLEDFQYAMQLLKLLEWDEEALDDSDLRRTSTKKDLQARGLLALARFLTGSWMSGILQHSCGLGCCTRGITETRQRLHDLVMATHTHDELAAGARREQVDQALPQLGLACSDAEHAWHAEGHLGHRLLLRWQPDQ